MIKLQTGTKSVMLEFIQKLAHRNRYRIIWGQLLFFLFLNTALTHAANLQVYSVEDLALGSDLIILGRQISDTNVLIEKVLLGTWPEEQINLPDLQDFPTSVGEFDRIMYLKNQNANVVMGEEVLVFIELHNHFNRGEDKLSILGNGVMRQAEVDGHKGVYGYWQIMNPGGYVLNFTPISSNMDDLVKDVALALEGSQEAIDSLLARLSQAKDTRTVYAFWGDLRIYTNLSNEQYVRERLLELSGNPGVLWESQLYWDMANFINAFKLSGSDETAAKILANGVIKTKNPNLLSCCHQSLIMKVLNENDKSLLKNALLEAQKENSGDCNPSCREMVADYLKVLKE